MMQSAKCFAGATPCKVQASCWLGKTDADLFFHIFPHFSKIERSKKYLPHIGVQYIKLKPMKFHIEYKRNSFGKNVCLGSTLNLGVCSKFWANLREFWEILGKYRILEGRPLGSIGLRAGCTS